MPERCACCGEIIPEGRQVCPNCERSVQDEKQKQCTDIPRTS